jgi:hypothetical protein
MELMIIFGFVIVISFIGSIWGLLQLREPEDKGTEKA